MQVHVFISDWTGGEADAARKNFPTVGYHCVWGEISAVFIAHVFRVLWFSFATLDGCAFDWRTTLLNRPLQVVLSDATSYIEAFGLSFSFRFVISELFVEEVFKDLGVFYSRDMTYSCFVLESSAQINIFPDYN